MHEIMKLEKKNQLIYCYFNIIAQYLRNLIDRLSERSVDASRRTANTHL